MSKVVSLTTSSNSPERTNFNGAPAFPLGPFTGERMIPGQVLEPLFLEHEARYLFAGKYVQDKVALDVACGAGIGTHYLLQAGAHSCMGLDIDEPTINEAKATYHGCQFEQCDATSLIVSDNSVEVVVSFETIEHLSDQGKFLSECRRVLKPGGLLICSTPNRTLTRWAPENPFHLCEFTVEEFKEALNNIFVDVQLFGQENVNQLRYAGERLLSRALHALQVMSVVKRLVGRKPPPPMMRSQFGGVPADPIYEIRPYRASLFSQPKYVVAIARKSA